jgi:hypothetical protein
MWSMIMYDMVYMSIIGKSHLIEVDWHEDEGKIIWYHILCCTHFRHVVSLVEYYDIIVALWVHRVFVDVKHCYGILD